MRLEKSAPMIDTSEAVTEVLYQRHFLIRWSFNLFVANHLIQISKFTSLHCMKTFWLRTLNPQCIVVSNALVSNTL